MAKGSENQFPHVLVTEQGSTPANPAAGDQKLFIDSADNKLKRVNSAGGVTTIEGAGVTDAEYLTAAAHADLSAEVVIPGLAGSADISGAGGAGTSEEYDTSTTGLTWNNAPATVDSDTTILSHLYVRNQADTTERIGSKAWAPAGALDARCKLVASWPAHAQAITGTSGLHIGNSGNTSRVLLLRNVGVASGTVQAYTYATGSYTARGTAHTTGLGAVYLRIVRDGSNNWTFYWSPDGLLWFFMVTQALTFTVDNIGFRIVGNASGVMDTAVDWLRTSV